jgi:hypothetical protein
MSTEVKNPFPGLPEKKGEKMLKGNPVATCRHCGEGFTKLKDGKIVSHDYPKPCRSVCRGSGHPPKEKSESPLWKDDPTQEGRDFYKQARAEILLYGFAVVKEMAAYSGQQSGNMACPLCGNEVRFSIAPSNGHCAARCQTESCINAME